VSGDARRAVFLDRDGVLNPRPPEHTYLTSAGEFEWLPGAREAVVALKEAGWKVAVVSNQRGVARGLVSTDVLAQIEQRIQRDLRPAAIDGFYYCPHDLDAGCDCRKPHPGLLMRAASELGVDRSASWMIGDDANDVAAGRAAGCRTILIAPDGHDPGDAELVEPDLLSATRRLC